MLRLHFDILIYTTTKKRLAGKNHHISVDSLMLYFTEMFYFLLPLGSSNCGHENVQFCCSQTCRRTQERLHSTWFPQCSSQILNVEFSCTNGTFMLGFCLFLYQLFVLLETFKMQCCCFFLPCVFHLEW